MSDSYVTQCPHCDTTFRVTEQHLNAAGGSVRCGACLKIFSAKEHLLQKSGSPSPAAGSSAASTRQAHTPSQTPNTAVSEPSDSIEHFSANKDDDDLVFEDDPLFDDLDDMDKASTDGQPPESTFPLVDEGFGELSEEITTVAPDIRAQRAHQSTTHANPPEDDQWDALDDSLFQQPDRPQLNTGKQDAQSGFTSDSLRIETDDPDDAYPPGTGSQRRQPVHKAKQMADHIDAEPLELHFDSRSGKRWLWTLGSMVLVLTALLQVVWYGKNDLALNPALRPWYDKLCQPLGCELPPMVDVSQFRTGNLILRKDLRRPGNLIVDAILINQAAFDQPFPDLILTFKNINGQLIADGRFAPDQYLSGEMTGVQLIPSKTPVHISFSVVSPGDDAVNYSLRYQ